LLRFSLPVILFLTLSACGYVGEPLPPLLNIPQPVEDLAAIQRGPKILVEFTLPKLTTEGVVIKQPLQWDLRVGESDSGDFRMEAWAARAHSLPGGVQDKGRVKCEAPAAPWFGKELVLAVRTIGTNGRRSGWSKALALSVIPPPPAPRDVKAQNAAEGVLLTWAGSGQAYRIYRRAAADKDFILAGRAESTTFVDRGVEYGKPYLYYLQAVNKAGSGEVESEVSVEASISPEDLFPPAVPGGLQAVPTPTSIELAWDRVTDADLAGYRIYRAAPGGELEKLADTTESPSYTDRKIESGKQYRYAVSAFDKRGNESKMSGLIEVTAP
jgi:hypothetical protein